MRMEGAVFLIRVVARTFSEVFASARETGTSARRDESASETVGFLQMDHEVLLSCCRRSVLSAIMDNDIQQSSTKPSSQITV